MKIDVKLTEAWLQVAINRHDRHMAGKEPIDGKDEGISQKLLMEEMKYALKALTTGHLEESKWYSENIKKFPDKKASSKMPTKMPNMKM